MSLRKSYHVKNIVMEVGNTLIDGYVPDSFLSVERKMGDFNISNGMRSKNNDLSGNIEFSLLESSPSNKIFMNFLKADREFNRGIFPIVIKDLAGNILNRANSAWVMDSQGYPERGINVGERAWVLEAISIESGIQSKI